MTAGDMEFKNILRDAGFRATPGRLALLILLKEAGIPQSVRKITARLRPRKNEVTVYRALEALTGKGILTRVDFQHEHAHYELRTGAQHHHHLVCNSCGTVEDVGHCPAPTLEKEALRDSKQFNIITSHAFELFGTCAKCA